MGFFSLFLVWADCWEAEASTQSIHHHVNLPPKTENARNSLTPKRSLFFYFSLCCFFPLRSVQFHFLQSLANDANVICFKQSRNCLGRGVDSRNPDGWIAAVPDAQWVPHAAPNSPVPQETTLTSSCVSGQGNMTNIQALIEHKYCPHCLSDSLKMQRSKSSSLPLAKRILFAFPCLTESMG